MRRNRADMRLIATTRSSSSARAGAFGVGLPRAGRATAPGKRPTGGRIGAASGAAAVIPVTILEAIGLAKPAA